MTAPVPAPTRPAGIQNFGPGVLTLGETGSLTDWASLVNGCTLAPTTSPQDPTTKLSGYVRGGSQTTTWVLSGNVDTDAGNAAGLWQLCFDLAGSEVEFEFTPQVTDTPGETVTVSGLVTLAPLPLGADEYGADLTADFEFPVTGTPTITRDAGV